MQIKFNGQYDKKRFFAAVRLANSPQRNRRVVYLLVWMVLGVMLVSAVGTFFETREVAPILLHLALIVLLGAVLWQAYLPPYLAARKMWANPSVRRTLHGVVTKQGITYNFSAGQKSYTWGQISRVRKTGNLVTLVTNGGMLLVFPRGFFRSQTDWERFVKLVETRILPTVKLR
ncbi:MAG: YcxB family protein [Chloroflexi bacterium]|nr:YcxB family protein [Chloroflexota bacterium]